MPDHTRREKAKNTKAFKKAKAKDPSSVVRKSEFRGGKRKKGKK